MPAAELYGGISAFKTMMDIAKAMKDMDTAARRNEAVIELQEKILAAQSAQAALLEHATNLEKQVASFEKWEGEKERYELKALTRGFTAYVLKKPERDTATPHALCTNCYERSFKSVLQSNGKVQLREHAWICPACKGLFACQNRDMLTLIQNLDHGGTVE